MPIANFKCVREVSSEDVNFKAENLLQQTGKKWKTKHVGEKSAYVIFELEKLVQIVGIDLGNEHSAFAEVLVSKTGCRTEDFTEILITSSFMTPFESKGSTNPNRVRCFGYDTLVPSVASEKWHLVKVICTQPFNKHVQYGLSFIKIHIADTETAKLSSTPKTLVPERFLGRRTSSEKKDESTVHKNESNSKHFAKFALREESPDSESESSISLFNRWKTSRQNVDSQPSTATAIRQASTPVGLNKLKLTQTSRLNSTLILNNETKTRDRNREELAFGVEEDEQTGKQQRLIKHIDSEKQRLQKQNEETSIKKAKKTEKVLEQPKKVSKENSKEKSPTENDDIPSCSRKRHSSPTNIQPAKKVKAFDTLQYRPFNQLLKNVVLVISGIQNPDRANLRGKALAMGAKYKADWEPGCTHLICAFKNTPKYNQVKGKGKIVTRSWIEKCFDLKKYLPWRRYALDSDEQAKPESDIEILDESLKPAIDVVIEDNGETQRKKIKRTNSNTATNSRNSTESISDQPFCVDSGSDTDDYIEDIKQKNSNKENRTPAKERDVYDLSTEEEEYINQKTKENNISLNFFKNLKFFIAKEIADATKDQLTKCIKHYDGFVITSMEHADYLIAEKFKSDALNFSGEIVTPQWIFECNDMEKMVPTKLYLVNKS